MTTWQETVIQAIVNPDEANTHVLRYDAVELIKQAQAKLSFKAGEEQGYDKGVEGKLRMEDALLQREKDALT